jgi:hypothetical protein
MSRSDVLLKSITEFYDDPNHFDLLKNILEKKSGVSLRNLEWFITDYSKKRNLAYTTKSGKLFSVHMCDAWGPSVTELLLKVCLPSQVLQVFAGWVLQKTL